ncbi:hypothetical protein [Mycolicibacter kumamotonensis]|nr:hypothetical protein [Mycolicibacter kumamotonensis]
MDEPEEKKAILMAGMVLGVTATIAALFKAAMAAQAAKNDGS